MDPRIQYAHTKDGVRIAFMVAGDGVPVVHPFFYLSHLQLNWTNEYSGQWMRALSERYKLIAYDARGNGLSQRGIDRYGMEEAINDLEAVVGKLSLDRFVIFAPLAHGAAAIRYTLANEGRVLGLILWTAWSRPSAVNRTMAETLPKENWEFYLQAVAQTANWVEAGEVREYVGLLRQSMTQEDFAALRFADFDVEADLPHVVVPTLVLHPKEFVMVTKDEAAHMASLIPDSRLVLLEGASSLPTGDLLQPTVEAVAEFMSELGITNEKPRAEEVPAAFRTILFTDLVGHTEMMSRLGDERGREVLREHERITRDVLKAHGGTEVKTMGDGFMASFGSVTKAVECAVALQRAIGNWQSEIGERIAVRCGLNAGEPIEEEGDLFGATVILASRIAAKAEGGEILVADTVRGLCSGKGFLFSDRGEFVAKGFEESVRVYEVRWRE